MTQDHDVEAPSIPVDDHLIYVIVISLNSKIRWKKIKFETVYLRRGRPSTGLLSEERVRKYMLHAFLII